MNLDEVEFEFVYEKNTFIWKIEITGIEMALSASITVNFSV